LGAHFSRSDRQGLLDQLRVPGAGEADRLRKAGGVQDHKAVQRLAEVDRRDAQAGIMPQEGLQGIDELDSLGGDPVGAKAAYEGKPIGAQPACGFRRKTIALAGDLADIQQPVELGDFLLERHAAQQVGHAFGNGKGGILVGIGHGFLDGLWGEMPR